ncbi:hypothetical protein M569_01429 [Genlisea aurea]|uniref:Uncharacterized protein n=1 Tax=Genlisea aurea TaxID=192259 RepID=S8EL58_9LAMI|nr:hypothetical protein M569_01429 [Genlisea aurea]
MYGRKASELVRELAASDPGKISSFNNELFAQAIEECDGHFLHLHPLIRKVEDNESKLNEATSSHDGSEVSEKEKGSLRASLKSDQFGALIHHLSLVRNKRCLMAYIYNRAEAIRSLAWVVDRVLPEEIQQKLITSEKEYFKKHISALQQYMLDVDLQLTVDTIPPKDPYIKVRVLDDIGQVALSDQIANLSKNAIMFLRRIDAEQYIRQGQMEELTR